MAGCFVSWYVSFPSSRTHRSSRRWPFAACDDYSRGGSRAVPPTRGFEYAPPSFHPSIPSSPHLLYLWHIYTMAMRTSQRHGPGEANCRTTVYVSASIRSTIAYSVYHNLNALRLRIWVTRAGRSNCSAHTLYDVTYTVLSGTTRRGPHGARSWPRPSRPRLVVCTPYCVMESSLASPPPADPCLAT